MSDLDRRLHDHYSGASLSGKGLAQAREALLQDSDDRQATDRGFVERQSKVSPPFDLKRWSPYLRAAMIVLVLGLGSFWIDGRLVEKRWQSQLEGIAQEVALNHNKQLDLEFETEVIDALPQYMTRLDFTPVTSRQLASADLNMEGARYCSLGGAIAAQVRLRDVDGRAVTLYQVRAPEMPRRLGGSVKTELAQDFEAALDGVNVRLWHEAGLLMGVARAVR